MCLFFNGFEGLVGGPPDGKFAFPGTEAVYAPDRNFKGVHIKLELDVELDKKKVGGTCTTTLEAFHDAEEIIFDAVDMKIESVLVDGKKQKYDYDGKKLKIIADAKAGQKIEVEIRYSLTDPKKGVLFVLPDKDYPDKKKQAWTHSEPEEARYWFPCHDAPHDRITTETIITVPKGFFALSNGALVGREEKGGKEMYHWRMSKPHATYLVTFVVGEFSEIREEWNGIPVTYYCERGREEETKRAFGKTPKMLDFFSQQTGTPYPYEKYAQVAVQEFVYGGMEHTTATTQTDTILVDERGEQENWHDELVAHELAHHWFGNMLTCKDWSHAWLNESFATYFEALFMGHEKGEDDFFYELYQNLAAYLNESKERYSRAISTNVFRRVEDTFDRHLYQKGSLVLHMLRNVLGETQWKKAVHRYVEKNKFKTVETLDLITAVEEATGRNMKEFFDQWIFSPGHPDLRINYHWDEKGKEAVLRVVQNQQTENGTPLYNMPITFKIVTQKGEKNFTEGVSQKQQLFKYKLDSEPLIVTIDHGSLILKTLEFIKPVKMWLYQLENGNVLGRIAAAQELAKIGSGEAVAALRKRFSAEKFWGAQAEIAKALGTITSEGALDALIAFTDVKNVKVRRAVVEAIGGFGNRKAVEGVKKCLADGKSYFVPAMAAVSIGKSKDMSVLELLKKQLSVESWNDVIKSGALAGIAQLRASEAADIIMEHAKRGFNQRSRMTAIRNLPLVGKGRKDVLDFIIEMTNDDFSLVQIIATQALGDMQDERAVPVLEKLINDEHKDGRVKRSAEESLRKIYTWLDSDKMFKLEKENEDLKNKLGRMKDK